MWQWLHLQHLDTTFIGYLWYRSLKCRSRANLVRWTCAIRSQPLKSSALYKLSNTYFILRLDFYLINALFFHIGLKRKKLFSWCKRPSSHIDTGHGVFHWIGIPLNAGGYRLPYPSSQPLLTNTDAIVAVKIGLSTTDFHLFNVKLHNFYHPNGGGKFGQSLAL